MLTIISIATQNKFIQSDAGKESKKIREGNIFFLKILIKIESDAESNVIHYAKLNRFLNMDKT